MSSNSKSTFEINKADIEQLWDIHKEIGGEGRGRKHGVEVLNRSVIIFVTACWESYIEDLAIEAFDFLLKHAQSASAIPGRVKSLAIKDIKNDPNSLKLWDLADSGWRTILLEHKADVHDKWLGKFNTPKSEQVDRLYEEMLGLNNLSSNWAWHKMTPNQAKTKLDAFISSRGNIAHRIRDAKPVAKNTGAAYLNHVRQIVDRCEQAVADHLKLQTGAEPW
ncbi:HEPN domain-containing protein [Pseudomonas phoenicis]|uniref:HEPN domain-containing protein n=1 Tax=unclassified Pseudomonas TaxID=196821 RepID=UPI00399F8502